MPFSRLVIAAAIIALVIALSSPSKLPPAPAVVPEPPKVAAPPPPKELTPEEKAAEEARKARKEKEDDELAVALYAVKQIRSSMKNPKSFELESAIRMDDGSLCLRYRATNSFNAVVPGEAVITKRVALTSDDRENFVPVWNRVCTKKAGTNITYIRFYL